MTTMLEKVKSMKSMSDKINKICPWIEGQPTNDAELKMKIELKMFEAYLSDRLLGTNRLDKIKEILEWDKKEQKLLKESEEFSKNLKRE